MSDKKTKSPAAPQIITSSPSTDLNLLPPQVARIRARILEACRSGDIEKLRSPIEWNELYPMFDHGGKDTKGPDHMVPGADPVEFLKSQSFDKKGFEILRILTGVFESPFLEVKQGSYVSYVWPAFAFVAAPPPEAEEQARRWRCVRFADLAKSGADGQPLYWRANIGADGTWHYFWPGI